MKNKILLTIFFSIFGITLSMAQLPSYVPSNGLVGYWQFDGNANDASGNGNNGTVSGAVLANDRFGNINNAYIFDTSPDKIEIPNSTQLQLTNSYSISVWIKPINNVYGSGPNYHSIVEKWGGTGDASYLVGLRTNGVPFFDTDNGTSTTYLDSDQPMLNNIWTNIVFIQSNDTAAIYINGILDTMRTGMNIPFVMNNDLKFAANDPYNQGSALDSYEGYLDDIGIWSRPLTSVEISNLYQSNTLANCQGTTLPVILTQGLLAWYPFCGNASDESGFGHNGNVLGATLTTDRFGNANSAYFFPGDVNNKIVIQHDTMFDFQNAFTVSAWAKFDQSWSFHVEDIIYKGTFPFNNGWELAVNQDDAMYGVGNYSMIGGLTIGSGAINANYIQPFSFINSWRHVVLTYDGQYSRLYIDGTLSDSLSISTPILNNTSNIVIGGSINPVSGAYNRNIDDIGIWNRALSPNEITTLYTTGICYQTITVTDTLIINANLTGFNPVVYQNSIKVYPNPSNDHITIDCGSNFSTLNGYSMRINNSIGQTVFTTPITQQSYYIDLNTWTGNGLYLIYLLNSNSQVIDVRKIIIQ